MSGGKKAHVVAVNMGYGHERPAHSLKGLASGSKITIANDYPGIPESDKKIWTGSQKWYERISRFKRVPIAGPLVFGAMDHMQEIEPFYPKRDLSEPTLQVKNFYYLIRKRKFMRHLIEGLSTSPRPLVSTFMATSFAAEEHGYPEEIFTLCTDSDISRAWAPLDPIKSRIQYFAPSRRVMERLKLYGIKEKNILFTGFPLPTGAIGKDQKALNQDLSRRLKALDPNRIFYIRQQEVLCARFGAGFCRSLSKTRTSRPIHIAFCVGGAGAQREIADDIIKSLKSELRRGRIKLTLVAGSRPEVGQYFQNIITSERLRPVQKKGGITILLEKNRKAYFTTFAKSVRKFDILWTKPSELSFYAGLGLPIIMAPTIGSQEVFNRDWLLRMGGGRDQLDPRYTNEWLFDWIESGALARMAWHGFQEAPTEGVHRIEEIVS